MYTSPVFACRQLKRKALRKIGTFPAKKKSGGYSRVHIVEVAKGSKQCEQALKVSGNWWLYEKQSLPPGQSPRGCSRGAMEVILSDIDTRLFISYVRKRRSKKLFPVCFIVSKQLNGSDFIETLMTHPKLRRGIGAISGLGKGSLVALLKLNTNGLALHSSPSSQSFYETIFAKIPGLFQFRPNGFSADTFNLSPQGVKAFVTGEEATKPYRALQRHESKSLQ